MYPYRNAAVTRLLLKLYLHVIIVISLDFVTFHNILHRVEIKAVNV